MNFAMHQGWLRFTAIVCAALIAPGGAPLVAQQPAAAPPAAGADEKPKLKSPDQLDSLVAQIALYPDPLWRRSWRLPRTPSRSCRPSGG